MVTGGTSLRTKIRFAGCFIVVLVLVLTVCGLGPAARSAHANGALPASLGVLLPADRAREVILATNFGMILSDDGGQSWQWTCEQDATSMRYLYTVGPPPRDRIYGLSPEKGLSFSDDGTCTWQRAGGVLDTAIASDYFVDPTDPDHVLAIAATLDESGDLLPQSMYASGDGGVTFGATPVYTAPPSSNVVSVEIARSNPQIAYLGMYGYPGRHPVLLRSSDGGQTWVPRDVEPALGANEFRILAVDPDDPDRLYLRVIALGAERVAISTDGGATFVTAVEVANGVLSGFARLASGTVLVAGLINLPSGGTNGVGYRSPSRGDTFSPWVLSPQPHILGLAERDGVVYVAGKNYSDSWALATSTDEGATLTPRARYEDVRAIKPCAQQTCAAACEDEVRAAVWTSAVCTSASTPPGDSGCGCRAARAGGDTAGLSVVMVLAAALRRRSTRTSASRSARHC